MVKNFNHFVDREMSSQLEGSYDKLWSIQLSRAEGDAWKKLRHTFSPVFTSGRMKVMINFIRQSANELTQELESKSGGEEEVNLKGMLGKFTMSALSSATFGISLNAFQDESSPFVKYAADLLKVSDRDGLRLMIAHLLSKYVPGVKFLMSYFDINVFKKKETIFFHDFVQQILQARRESGERRNDIIDLMLDCMKEDGGGAGCEDEASSEEQLVENAEIKSTMKDKNKELDERSIIATAMIFMIAGYDTTATTLSFLFYNLSKHPEIQAKLQREVDEAFASAGEGEFPDYHTIFTLPYLDMVIHEALRRNGPVGMNSRIVTEDCKLPGTEISLKKGDMISFSVQGVHEDPAHYSHPTDFHPEHFSKEEKSARSAYAYQAFGQGPRSCIGMRFALLEVKVAVLAVLKEFTFLPGDKSLEPLELDPTSRLTWPKGDLWARIVKRN